MSLNLLLRTDIPGQLSKLGYQVEVKEATFQGYDSQKISAEKDNEKVLLQIVKDVKKDSSIEILKNLESPIESAQKTKIISDPYTGKKRELSVPEELKPIQEEKIIEGKPVIYYIIYANEIFSLRIFSEAEAKYKGLFLVYFCDNKKSAYKLEIYYPIEDFNKERAVNTLSSLFCQ